MRDTSSSYAYASITINGVFKLHIRSYHYHSESKTKHCALLQQLTKDDRIEIYGHGDQHDMDDHDSVFGVFKIG
jgi:hypothetical protein